MISSTASGSAATRSRPRRRASSSRASAGVSRSRVIGWAPSAATRPARWLRLVTSTRQVGAPGSSGRTWAVSRALSNTTSIRRPARWLRYTVAWASRSAGSRSGGTCRASRNRRTASAGLRGTAPLPGDNNDGGGRTTSLPASVRYSFTHLDPPAHRPLPAVSLFHGVADADVLTVFAGVAGVPDRFRGHNTEDWVAMLDRAAAVGLLSPLGAGMYRIHPALPAYLAARWRADEPDAYQAQRA